MFVILLRFSSCKNDAPKFLEVHKQWLKRGFDEGIFLLAGSLEPGLGGGILAHRCTITELQQRVNEDPFVSQQVVSAEILEIDPGMTDERLQFLAA